MSALPGYLRALLLLGRVSNVPTVWSNCLAGWLLSGGGSGGRFALLGISATCLYIGGMFLNDAFDAQFDQQHRPERPIPSGAISLSAVWIWGAAWLLLGLTGLAQLSHATLVIAVLLVLAILLYDAVHKLLAFSPVLMAVCRLLLILLAASAGRHGITGLSLWSGLVMASYIIGLSYLARRESLPATLRYWPCLALAAPLVLALIVNRGEHQLRAVLLSALLTLWILNCLRFTLWSPQRNVGRTVSGLLAAIPVIDLLSVWDGSPVVAVTFLSLFGLALLFQRFVPAT